MFADRTLFGLGGQSRRENPIYLLPNGLTKVAADWAEKDAYYTLSLDEGLPEETYYVFGEWGWYESKSLTYALTNTYDPESDTILPYGGSERVKLCNVITTFVSTFESAFYDVQNARHITADIASWDMRRATNIERMFGQARVLDSVIEYWDPKSVKWYTSPFSSWLQHDIDLSRWNFDAGFDKENLDPDSKYPSDKNLPTGGTVKERTFDTLHLVMVDGTEHILTETDNSLGVTATIGELRVNNRSVVEVKDWPTFFKDKGTSFDVLRIYLEGSSGVKRVPHYLPLGITSTANMFNNLKDLVADFRYFLTHRVTNMMRMFRYTSSNSGKITGFRDWNTTNLTNIQDLFLNSSIGEEDLNWDTSNVRNAAYAFSGCKYFNGDISSFRLPKVTDLSYMFYKCAKFNQDITGWDTSNVTAMSYMFSGCTTFDQPLDSWNVSNVTYMLGMFNNCRNFNQPLNDWDVSNVTSMGSMFYNCSSFNQSLNTWNVSKVTNMSSMFRGCSSFNQPLDKWNVSNVTGMRDMFLSCSSFNQDLSGWCVSKIPTIPNNFDTDTTAWTKPRPVWGTCPQG